MALALPPLAAKEDALMKRNWTIGLCLTLLLTPLLIGGFALDASAQQPSAPAPATPAVPDGSAPSSPPPPPAPQVQAPAPSTNVQTDTRTEKTERIVEREPGTFLGVNPTIALLVGAAVLIVIVFSLVAMSRRRDEVRHTHQTRV
jgi:hypothetical protein